jgi:hypothetical protein
VSKSALGTGAAALLVVSLASGVSPASAGGSRYFTHNVLPGLANATDLGPAPASGTMRLVVDVARPTPRPRRGCSTGCTRPDRGSTGTS